MNALIPDTASESSTNAIEESTDKTNNDLAKTNTAGDQSSSETNTALVYAQQLHAESDLYLLSKRTLAPATQSKVLNVFSQFRQGEIEESLKAINALLISELNLSSAVYVLAGDIAAANALRDQATKHYQNALDLNEYNAKAANRLGMMARANGQFELAETFYSQAINARPSMPEAYRNRAVLYDLYLQQKDKALNDYQAYSALLEYELESSKSGQSLGDAQLSEAQTKALQKDIKLTKRWVVDVGRQVTAIARANGASNTGGN
jgi:tetratricopeptide (TPR) repeat protein